MKARNYPSIKEVREHYYVRWFSPNKSRVGLILECFGILLAMSFLTAILFVCSHWVWIIPMSVITILLIKGQCRGWMWIQRKSDSIFSNKNRGEFTENPKVLLRSELRRSTVNGVPVGCTWGIDIDGREYDLK